MMEAADLRELLFLNARASYEPEGPYPGVDSLMRCGYVMRRPVARPIGCFAYYLTDAGKALVAALVGHANALSLPVLRGVEGG